MNNIVKTTMKLALGLTVAATLMTGCGGGGTTPSGDTGSTTNGSTSGGSGNTNSGSAHSSGGIFSYNGLQWQDDGTIDSKMVDYAYRNDYCDALSLGGNSDWRLPTLAEYKELNKVKDQLDFSWSEENYIFWTADEATSGGKEYISVFNLSKGVSVLFHVDKIFSPWGIRCVRGGTAQNEEQGGNNAGNVTGDNTEPVVNADVSTEGNLNYAPL